MPSISTFFFLYQQFITWYMVTDCGSYFVTTYKRGKLTWKLKKRNKREEDRELIMKSEKEKEKRKRKVKA